MFGLNIYHGQIDLYLRPPSRSHCPRRTVRPLLRQIAHGCTWGRGPRQEREGDIPATTTLAALASVGAAVLEGDRSAGTLATCHVGETVQFEPNLAGVHSVGKTGEDWIVRSGLWSTFSSR